MSGTFKQYQTSEWSSDSRDTSKGKQLRRYTDGGLTGREDKWRVGRAAEGTSVETH